MDVFDLSAKITLNTSEYTKGLADASSQTSSIGGKIASGLGTAAKATAAAVGAASVAIGGLVKSSIDAYANYEQLVGGVETLFGEISTTGDASKKVLENASKAYKTAGLSANQYMETATSFAASLMASLENDANAAADAADMNTDLNAAAIFAAYGGPLGVWGIGGGAIGYELAKEDIGIKAINALSRNKITSLPNSFTELNTFADGGSIHIKPSKRGTFTAAAKKHGKGVQEFARQVLANKENYSPTMVKKANFARNAAKWKHGDGGPLSDLVGEHWIYPNGKETFIPASWQRNKKAFGGELTNGGVFSNGTTIIGNGGTHEENPMEGVPMGVDAEGAPNLVEQGENE